ncbi:cullin [Phanerochaete sordida]|uniref:Cullin n=1 Tax=Phanerochaete sordida TaxID=48140 RepID=A0A9P3GLK4_9APHY|nr:cullin [Phanerochaete sordida]
MDIPPSSADLDTMWAYLEHRLDEMLTRPKAEIPYALVMSVYAVCCNYCTTSRAIRATQGSRQQEQAGQRVVDARADLYGNLVVYFEEYVKRLWEDAKSLQGEELLSHYTAEWDRYVERTGVVGRAFNYLHRHWVEPRRVKGEAGIYTVDILALVQWKKYLFLPLQSGDQTLTRALLRMFERHRGGELVDQQLVKKAVDAISSLGVTERNPVKASQKLYEEHVETPFLDAAEAYYRVQAGQLADDNDIPGYLQQARALFRDHENAAEQFLKPTARSAVVKRWVQVFIREHDAALGQYFQALLDSHDTDGLSRVHASLAEVPGALHLFYKTFEDDAKRAGNSAMAKLHDTTPDLSALDPKAFVDTCLEVRQTYLNGIETTFSGDAGFVAALDDACRGFVNSNAFTGASTTKSAELLAKRADALLRKTHKEDNEEDTEESLKRVMALFWYIGDKDVFQQFYTIRLSKRLIHGVSASEEAEAEMIARLKEACGSEYTSKLQRMFTDVSLSKDLTEQFKAYVRRIDQEPSVDLSVMVLGTNLWPLSPPVHDFIIPADILPVYDRFTAYYQQKHAGRKLWWLWDYSKNEVHTRYLDQTYIFMTSTYQMAVLVLYNASDSLSFEELQAATSISDDILRQVLAPLVKAKVLLEGDSDKYDLNLSFKSKKVRINLNAPLKAEQTTESHDKVLKSVETERRYVIQATIVRIMKAQKKLKGQQLVQDVVAQLSQRFTPVVADIHKAVQLLLEKEYIERAEGEPGTFAYVA